VRRKIETQVDPRHFRPQLADDLFRYPNHLFTMTRAKVENPLKGAIQENILAVVCKDAYMKIDPRYEEKLWDQLVRLAYENRLVYENSNLRQYLLTLLR
jgi:hypothetical protein